MPGRGCGRYVGEEDSEVPSSRVCTPCVFWHIPSVDKQKTADGCPFWFVRVSLSFVAGKV